MAKTAVRVGSRALLYLKYLVRGILFLSGINQEILRSVTTMLIRLFIVWHFFDIFFTDTLFLRRKNIL